MQLPKLNNRYASIISVLIVGLIILYYLPSVEFAAIGGAIILLAFIWEAFGSLVEKVWMAISKVIGFVMPKVMLSIVFFFILTPVALLSRILKKEDSMNKKNAKQSFWQKEEMKYHPDSFEKMW